MTSLVHHSRLLPPSLTSLLYHYRITSFHLTLSSGRWSPSWPLPAPPHSSTPSTPASGIELYAFLELLEGESASEEKKRWEGFVGALGGLVCTGINGGGTGMGDDAPASGYAFEGFGRKDRKFDHDLTKSEPKEGDRGHGLIFLLSRLEHRLYRSLRPKLSATCTESLTPFLSLLPCAAHAGLSSLLNPHKLFDGDWTLLGFHFTREETEGVVRLEVGSVGDPVRKERRNGGMGKRGTSIVFLHSLGYP